MTPFGAAMAGIAITAAIVATGIPAITTVITAVAAVIAPGMIAACFAPANIAATTLDMLHPAAPVVVPLRIGGGGQAEAARDQGEGSRKLEYPHRVLL